MGTPRAVNTTATSDNYDVILFDGVCNLCNFSVKFIIKRDRAAHFKFASLQSFAARQLMVKADVNPEPLSSVILIRQQKIYQRSDAVLEIVKKLDGGWPVLYAAKIIPRFIRDFIYIRIARNRYKLFGEKDTCMIPTSDIQSRFL